MFQVHVLLTRTALLDTVPNAPHTTLNKLITIHSLG